ncbi:MAG: hypothetical protein AABY22_04130 [Nanoarchaeota archaeon]
MSEEVLEDLLEKHSSKTISQIEREELHKRLREKYQYGETMSEYKCPHCEKPLVLTYSKGPACWLELGCRFNYGKI